MSGKLPKRFPPKAMKKSGDTESGKAKMPAFAGGKKKRPMPQAGGTGPGFTMPGGY